jgi:hydroxylamine reductase (hybrid-cluster protein)
MCKCPPTLINPALVKTLQETFGIKEITEPTQDLEATLAE